ncbi:MAG: glutamate 5-kinase [Candidatus Omnitrophica bacterium]|nr:glutamate 5-kinase [Candidatus Omnitrophota bacterium]
MGESQDVRRFVVKVGTSVLTDAAGRVLLRRIESLAEQLAACRRQGRQPILVSSGAIACGMAKLNLPRRPKGIAQLQACAAIGQSELMHLYTLAFGAQATMTAQVLLTQDDLSNRTRFANAKQTLLTLLHRHVVPIINENDTVAVEEITFGDNDRLAALVAVAVDAQLLVILSDVDGLLQDGKIVERVEALDHGPRAAVHGSTRETTKGGMASKLDAARMAGHHGIPMVIANGTRASVLTDLLAGQPVGTLFVPPRNRLSSRKWWIAFSLRQPRGELIVDAGAAQALSAGGKSLLPSGVVAINGRFEAGAFVAIKDEARDEVARGVCNYSSTELLQVRGMKSADAARTLGQTKAREVVHRDHLVLAKEMQA